MGELVYIKLATKANGHPNQQKMMPSSSLDSHALSLTLKALEPLESTKANRDKLKMEPVEMIGRHK